MNKTVHSPAFCANSIIKVMESNNYKNCVFLSTLKHQKKAEIAYTEIEKQIKAQTLNNKIVTKFIPNILNDYDAFLKCNESDCIILLEQYGKTKYNDLFEILEIFKNNNLTLLGVCTI